MDLQVPKGDTLHQKRPNNGSNGEECPTMEHGRYKVGLVPREIKKPTVESANGQQTTEIITNKDNVNTKYDVETKQNGIMLNETNDNEKKNVFLETDYHNSIDTQSKEEAILDDSSIDTQEQPEQEEDQDEPILKEEQPSLEEEFTPEESRENVH
eukprot:7830567-Ditylum_brightwellii.AAC.1